MKFIIATLLVFISIAPIRADEYEVKALRYLELGNSIGPALNLMDSMLETMAPTMTNQLVQGFQGQGKNVARDDVVALVAKYRIRLVAQFGEKLVPLMVTELRKHMTEDELTSVIEVMKLPAFQVYASKIPAITVSAQKAGEQLGATLGAEVMKELIAENPKFQ